MSFETDLVRRREEMRAEQGGDGEYGRPDADVFDLVCNDLLRLELHVQQSIARLELMAGTRGHPTLSHPQRSYVRNARSTLQDVETFTGVYADRVEQVRKGLSAIFGHLGECERIP